MAKHSASKKAPAGSRKAKRATARARRKAVPRSRLGRFMFRWGWIFPVLAIFVGGGILAVTYVFARIPLPADIKLDSSAEVFDANGDRIGTFSGEERRFLIDTEKLIKRDKTSHIGEAVIAAEDRDFYEHNGVSLRGIARAAWANVTGGEVAQGGSTITQQYIKNAVLEDFERTITRKVKEAILAIKLERKYSKEEILGFYLNTIYLGRGAYGIEAAARAYFGKHARRLDLAESAYLASIIPSPEQYQPNEQVKQAKQRRDRVLQTMLDEGFVTPSEVAKARKNPVCWKNRVCRKGADLSGGTEQPAAYFMEWIRRDILEPDKDIGGRRIYTGGFKIHTSLDLGMQAQAEAAVDSILTEEEDPQAALISMTPGGQVRAFVGGRAHHNIEKARGFIYATDQGRQAGSSFKPFTLLAAIDAGISPESRFSGASPHTFSEPPCASPEDPWEVDNYGGSSYGTITLDQATTSSVNTVFAQLIDEVGPQKVADLVEDMEFGEDVDPHCSLALGGSNVDSTPLQMARAYSAFNADGRLPRVTPVLWIEDSEGNCLKEYVPLSEEETGGKCKYEAKGNGAERVAESDDARVLTESLTHVVEGGTATGANIGRPVAGKTGTTQNNTDAWFVGYVPQLTTAVWMGYPCEPLNSKNKDACEDGKVGNEVVPRMQYCADPVECRPVHGQEVTGGSSVGPAAIWQRFMIEATAEMEVMDFPAPTEEPDDIINSPPPAPPAPDPAPEPDETETKEPEPEPSKEPDPEPTGPEPEPTDPEPEPTEPEPEPTIDPTGTPGP